MQWRGNRFRRNRHFVRPVDDLRFDLRICHGTRKVRVTNPGEMPVTRRQVVVGKKIFILNKRKRSLDKGRRGAELVYDVAYSEIKAWNRYEIVDSAKGADLVFELSYGRENPRTRVWTSTNTYNGTSQVLKAHLC